jgi:putative transposase
MCRQLSVSRSGYYRWKTREPSQRQKEDIRLKVAIKASHEQSRGTYGSPRIVDDLKEQGFDVSRRRVARLMAEEGITGTPKKPFKRTTDSKHSEAIADNTLDRNFNVDAPDTAWATDITYVRTWDGWMYLAVVVDLFSRRVIGWATATHMRTKLVMKALDMALGRRLPEPGLLHHSDRGSQYASRDYRKALDDRGIVCSMSRRGDCWDNAVVESFFATLKKELIHRKPWPTARAAREAIVEYIEVFYNRKRKHSTLGYLSPANFEDQYQHQEERIGKRRRGWQGGGLCLLSTRLAERRSEQPVSSREASDNARRPASGARGAGPRGGRAIESLRGAERS